MKLFNDADLVPRLFEMLNALLLLEYSGKLPVQFLPFPVNPSLQVQLWPPSVLLQTALTSQLWDLVLHSSMSNKKKGKKLKFRCSKGHVTAACNWVGWCRLGLQTLILCKLNSFSCEPFLFKPKHHITVL